MTRFPRRGSPDTFGWLRMPAHDRGHLAAWEHPNGVVYLIERGAELVQRTPATAPKPVSEVTRW